MLDTDKFVKSLIEQGYTHLCVVPCSFAKDVINSAINNSDLIEYFPCASEAVACSTAAGLKMAGESPIVIVQSSGLTNMGSCITTLLVPYEIRFPIIVSWRTYKEGDSEIQHQHLATRLPNLIDLYGYTCTILNRNSVELAITQIKECETKNQICVLEENTFLKIDLNKEHQLDLSQYPKRSEYLKILNRYFKEINVLFIGTTGNTSREMYLFMPNTSNFYMVGNMGGALSIGLGMAKAGKKVIVCGGDAEFVMHMGGLATTGRYSSEIKLTYLLFDNESNKSTGGQCTYQDNVGYLAIASSLGFNIFESIITNLSSFDKALKFTYDSKKASVLHIKCSYDSKISRPPRNLIRDWKKIIPNINKL
jgi:thiamine pyrophosphate-dependent acetolactate synthase large subunit-like protein